jgi:hypothetical protein
MEKNRTDPGLHRWFIPAIRPGSAIDSTHITFSEVFSIFFMQHWGYVFGGLGYPDESRSHKYPTDHGGDPGAIGILALACENHRAGKDKAAGGIRVV